MKIVRTTVAIMAVALAVNCFGCQGRLISREWRLIAPNADPTGRNRITAQYQAVDTVPQDGGLAVRGQARGEVEVYRWNLYEAKETWEGSSHWLRKKRVADPHGRGGEDMDSSLTADAINGIPRAPTGIGHTPLHPSLLPKLRIKWTLLAGETVVGQGTVPVVADGAFSCPLPREVCEQAANQSVADLSIRLEPESVAPSECLEFVPAVSTMSRQVFVRAIERG